MAERRTLALGIAAAAVVATPVTLALTDRHLADASTALVVSTSAGALAVSALAIQPLLARGRRIARHQIFGSIVLVLVLVHVAYDDGDYRAVYIRRVVDLDDERAVVNLTLARGG